MAAFPCEIERPAAAHLVHPKWERPTDVRCRVGEVADRLRRLLGGLHRGFRPVQSSSSAFQLGWQVGFLCLQLGYPALGHYQLVSENLNEGR